MAPETILKNQGIYIGQANIGGIQCEVGYIKKFEWRFAATQLNAFVVIGNTGERINQPVIENFSKESFKYSLKNSKGWPRGLQAVIGSIAILQGSNISEDAIGFCEKPPKKHWSAFEIPALYNTAQKEFIRYKNTPLWGAVYFPFFKETMNSIVLKLD